VVDYLSCDINYVSTFSDAFLMFETFFLWFVITLKDINFSLQRYVATQVKNITFYY